MAKVKNVANSQRHVLFHLFEFEWQNRQEAEGVRTEI